MCNAHTLHQALLSCFRRIAQPVVPPPAVEHHTGIYSGLNTALCPIRASESRAVTTVAGACTGTMEETKAVDLGLTRVQCLSRQRDLLLEDPLSEANLSRFSNTLLSSTSLQEVSGQALAAGLSVRSKSPWMRMRCSRARPAHAVSLSPPGSSGWCPNICDRHQPQPPISSQRQHEPSHGHRSSAR